MQRDLVDLDACPIAVERFLHQVVNRSFRSPSRLREQGLDVRLADDPRIVLSATCSPVSSALWTSNRYWPIVDAPIDDEIDVDRTPVAGQHQAFFLDVLPTGPPKPRSNEAERMPISVMFWRVTFGSTTSSIG